MLFVARKSARKCQGIRKIASITLFLFYLFSVLISKTTFNLPIFVFFVWALQLCKIAIYYFCCVKPFVLHKLLSLLNFGRFSSFSNEIKFHICISIFEFGLERESINARLFINSSYLLLNLPTFINQLTFSVLCAKYSSKRKVKM